MTVENYLAKVAAWAGPAGIMADFSFARQQIGDCTDNVSFLFT